MPERVILITGATGNLGRATARAFEAEGARLILVGSKPESLARAFPNLDQRHLPLAVDLTDAEATGRAITEAERQCGRIDAVCAVAGGFDMGEAVYEITPAAWDKMMKMNVWTMLNTVHAVVPGMIERKAGKIVTVGSSAALKGGARMGAYVSSKSTVMRLTESMSAELRGKGVNVNCVLPSTIDTPENRAAMPKADTEKWVKPEDLAAVIAFLCSDGAGAMHGALVPVTGLV
ncbi:SDR family NAD(P)-dependent oxidoreductase [Pseudaminobacter sp. 19-2017]|uniref:SDR family NAD(P)-dependent oxidoreductase n=1 Tax=Pseudaminobacter soli (ex Zhang et al. 2022) TaxID=2831468 RepID=A0A942I285_9HYPH|nr:SDR family NAD(P)-dependent oxidoreductase [Pseudaminobacter soli]MBS3649247.1 SDR family NAD(P)-dependent oxidoreductase [Pseudaminobacter soli]